VKFEDLDVWKRSARLSADIYKALINLKMERESPKECINFLSYAKGSCGELRTQVYIGMDIGYINEQSGKLWINETREISAMLVGLMRSIKHNKL